MKRVVLAIAALVASAATADACRWPRYRFFWGQAVNIAILVKAGEPCRTRLGGSGRFIDRVSIVERPAHGIAGSNLSSVAYRPNPGYVGPDRFTYRFESDQGRAGTPETATVRVRVMVRP